MISESGHVLGFSDGPNATGVHGRKKLVKLSARKASTFPGLCSEHDASVFSNIEKGPLKANYRSALSLSQRCALYEAVVHSDGALFSNWLHAVPRFNFAFDTNIMIPEFENMLHYAGYTWNLVALLSKIERRESIRKLYHLTAIVDEVLPFSGTGCFCIENDFLGRQLQAFNETHNKFAYAQISVLPQVDGTTVVSLASTSDKNKYVSRKFINSFRKALLYRCYPKTRIFSWVMTRKLSDTWSRKAFHSFGMVSRKNFRIAFANRFCVG
ncbi:hypothetical protein LY10_04089 [Planktotalea frisia]|nr:hypothetical protein LY10_04089 [Planktotalea frisia]